MARDKYFQKAEFLTAADIKNGQIVTVDKFEDAKTRIGVRPLLRLEKFDKPLGLNATNYDKMCEKFGETESKWSGKRIKLVIVMAPNPQKNNKEQPAIRIE